MIVQCGARSRFNCLDTIQGTEVQLRRNLVEYIIDQHWCSTFRVLTHSDSVICSEQLLLATSANQTKNCSQKQQIESLSHSEHLSCSVAIDPVRLPRVGARSVADLSLPDWLFAVNDAILCTVASSSIWIAFRLSGCFRSRFVFLPACHISSQATASLC